jgi:hypothetical protein
MAAPARASPSLEARLAGTRAASIRDEYLGSSAYFPLANILLEPLHEGWTAFQRWPDLHTLPHAQFGATLPRRLAIKGKAEPLVACQLAPGEQAP